MSLSEKQTENFTSKFHDNGIYELVMLNPTRRAVDDWIDQVAEIWHRHNETREPIPILSDNMKAENLPLRYAFTEGMKLTRQYPNLPKGRTAFITSQSTMTTLMNTFLRIMPLNIEFRYFAPHERQEAVAWLQEVMPAAQNEATNGMTR